MKPTEFPNDWQRNGNPISLKIKVRSLKVINFVPDDPEQLLWSDSVIYIYIYSPRIKGASNESRNESNKWGVYWVPVWRTMICVTSTEFYFKFWREEHWLQQWEWRSHIRIDIRIFIQNHSQAFMWKLASLSIFNDFFWIFLASSSTKNHGIIAQYSIFYF